MPIFSCLKLRPSSVNTLRPNPRRRGEVLDSLVIMIAGLLLPAWLLGHLFLTFYPAPASASVAETGDFETPAVTATEDTDSDLPATGILAGSDSQGSEAEDVGDESANPFKGQLESMKQKFDSLTQSSATLESEVATLKQSNASLAEENAQLKTRASQVSQTPGMLQDAAPDENSAVLNELQTKYDSASSKIETMQQSLQDATTRLESTENEKRTLQTSLANVRAKLDQAETDLAAAVSKNEASMEIGPESDSESSPFALLESEDDSSNTDLVAEANAKTAAANEKVAELERQLEEINVSLANTNNAMATQKEELRSAQMQMQTLQAQNGDLKTALNAARDNAASTIETQMPKEVFRDFVSSKGSVSKMAFIRWEGDDVIVRSFANKKLYRLSMDRFSDADQQYLMDQKKQ